MKNRKRIQSAENYILQQSKYSCFPSKEVTIQQIDKISLHIPQTSMWETFENGLNSFTEDIFEGVRFQGKQDERDNF